LVGVCSRDNLATSAAMRSAMSVFCREVKIVQKETEIFEVLNERIMSVMVSIDKW
jgi:hypothetical protein